MEAWTIFWIKRTKNLGKSARCHTPSSCTFLSTYMILELNIKSLWCNFATSTNLEITNIEWTEVLHPIVITITSLKQLQPRTWKITMKPRSEVLSTPLSALQGFTNVPQYNNTNHLPKHSVKKLIRKCYSSFCDNKTANLKRTRTNNK